MGIINNMFAAAPYAYGAGFGAYGPAAAYGGYAAGVAPGFAASPYGLGFFDQQHQQQHPGMMHLVDADEDIEELGIKDMAKSAWGKAKQVGGKVAAGAKKAYGAAKQGYKVAKPIVHGVADVAGKYGGAVCGAAGKYSKACKTGVKGIKK